MMRKTKDKLLFLVAVLIFVAMILWLVWEPKETEAQRAERQAYPELDSISHSIAGVIFSSRRSTLWNGTQLIMLKGNHGFSISGVTSNWDYKIYSFYSFIRENDSIYKPANTDSLYVYREGEKYYFIYGRSLNKNK